MLNKKEWVSSTTRDNHYFEWALVEISSLSNARHAFPKALDLFECFHWVSDEGVPILYVAQNYKGGIWPLKNRSLPSGPLVKSETIDSWLLKLLTSFSMLWSPNAWLLPLGFVQVHQLASSYVVVVFLSFLIFYFSF